MFLLAAGYLLFMIFIAPVTVQIKVNYSRQLSFHILAHIWGIPVNLTPPKRGGGSAQKPWKAIKEIKAIVKAFEVQYAGLNGILAFENADRTAQLWGLFCILRGSLEGWLHERKIPYHFHLIPSFRAASSTLEGGCILFARLGKLLWLALRFGLAYRRINAAQREEKGLWITRSGA